jgi:hypothetical protein
MVKILLTSLFLFSVTACTAVNSSKSTAGKNDVGVSEISVYPTLNGKKYCRTVTGNGVMGQPMGDMQHCVSFTENKMTDNGNTFFGNPPETIDYRMVGYNIEVKRQETWEVDYRVSGDELRNEVGAVLKLTLE